MLSIVIFLCYAAAAVFFGAAVFDWNMGGTDRIADGLFCVSLGLLLAALPSAAYQKYRSHP